MYLTIIGVNHKTAPVELRERLTVSDRHLVTVLARLRAHAHSAEFCFISTCNRTELYCVTRTRVEDHMLISFLAADSGVSREELESCVYRKNGHHTVRHLYEVACGLDSMALGETQILGQIKNAYCVADGCDCTGPILNNLFQRAIAVGKRARTETEISRGAFSIGAAAVQLAKLVFGDLAGRKAMLLGAGEMAKLAATHLRANGVRNVYIASRTRARSEELAGKLGGTPIDFDEVDAKLGEVDFVVSSTAASKPIITRERMARVMRERGHSPIFLIDIAVPRDVAANVAEIEGVFVYDIDDLQFSVDKCRIDRESEVEKVHAIIEAETAGFMTYLRSLEALPLIKQLRAKFDAVYAAEWQKYSSKLDHLSQDDRDYVRKMLRSAVKKLTHDPILRMKDYASDSDEKHKLDIVRELFGLPPTDTGDSD